MSGAKQTSNLRASKSRAPAVPPHGVILLHISTADAIGWVACWQSTASFARLCLKTMGEATCQPNTSKV